MGSGAVFCACRGGGSIAMQIVSGAFFGIRPDRDAMGYYREALRSLAEASSAPIRVFTNDVSQLDPRLDRVTIESMAEVRRRLVDAPDWEAEYRRRLAWHPKNTRLAQYQMVGLPDMYAGKMQLLLESCSPAGAFWIDAGLPFSVYYGHSVPAAWPGYSRERVDGVLRPFLLRANDEGRVVLTQFRFKRRLHKLFRPTFHGLSAVDMLRLAKRVGAKPDGYYCAACCQLIPASEAEQVRRDFQEIWQAMWDMGRAGTEETILTVMRWKRGYEARSTGEWLDLMFEPGAVPPIPR